MLNEETSSAFLPFQGKQFLDEGAHCTRATPLNQVLAPKNLNEFQILGYSFIRSSLSPLYFSL